jgi:hypothetical protein
VRRAGLAALALLALGGCGAEAVDAEPRPSWSTPLADLEPALLALVPDGAGEPAFAVGGALDAGGSPALFAREGDRWAARATPPGFRGAMWWGLLAAPDDLWVVGDLAQIVRGPPGSLAPVTLDAEVRTSTAVTWYGVWGASAEDVWVVGGAPRAREGTRGEILRFEGGRARSMRDATTPGVPYFKVWGPRADRVWVVGGEGTALLWDGARWSATATGTRASLTTVHGRGERAWAVGGGATGVVIEHDGVGWRSIGAPLMPPLSGVHAARDGRVWVAGEGGYLAWWDGARWTEVDTGLFASFHAVAAGAEDVFGVGGLLTLSSAPRRGFLGVLSSGR